MRKAYLLAVGFVLLLATFVAAVEKKEPKVKLYASPKISMASFGNRSLILLRLVITDADEELWCPEVKWEIRPGDSSSQESDCEPFSEADPRDIKRRSWIHRVNLPAGEWNICVRLKKSGDTIRKVCERVSVRGGE